MAAAAQPGTTQLFSGRTAITMEAGPSAPQLLRVAAWENRAPEALIDQVEIGAVSRPVQWEFQAGDSSVTRTRVDFIYESRNPRLRLDWEWKIRGAPGPAEHRILIQNLSGTEIWLPLQDSFRFDFRVPAQDSFKQFWVEKGASSPSAEGTHYIDLRDGSTWTGTSSTYAHPPKGEPREIIPYTCWWRAPMRSSPAGTQELNSAGEHGSICDGVPIRFPGELD